MTYPNDVSQLPRPLNEATHAHMPEYVLVFSDDRPPKEHAFTAISDAAAKDLMRKQYPRFKWALCHVDDRGRRDVFYHYEGPQGRYLEPPASAAGSTA